MHNNSYDFHAKLFSTYGDFELKANYFLKFWEVKVFYWLFKTI